MTEQRDSAHLLQRLSTVLAENAQMAAALRECRTSIAGYHLRHDPGEAAKLVSDLFNELQRIDKVARAALAPAAQGENDNYENTCAQCGQTFIGHKRKLICQSCAAPAPSAGETGTGGKIIDALEQAARGEADRVTIVELAAPPSAPPTRAAIIEECAKAADKNMHSSIMPGHVGKNIAAAIRALASIKQEPT